MSIIGLILLILILIVLLGGVPAPGDTRNVVLLVLVLVIVLWLCGALWGPLSYPARGVYWP